MNSTFNLLPAALLVAMLALAGCGGGSDSTSDNDDNADQDQAAMDKTAATNAITTANGLASALTDTSTAADVVAARAAITAAMTAIGKLPADEQAAYTAQLVTANGHVAKQEGRIAAEATAKTTADQKAMTAKAKTLKAAIGAFFRTTNPATGGAAPGPGTAVPTSLTAIETTGTGNPGNRTLPAITFGKGKDAGKIGNWYATDYTGSDGIGSAKKTGSARIYTNPVTASVPFTQASSGLAPVADKAGYFDLGDGTAADSNAASPKFPQQSGLETYIGADRNFAGTYKGASGTYVCEGTAATSCTVRYGNTGLTFSDGWEFKPAAGAMVKSVDANHLYFGWWLHEGKTAAGADEKFAGAVYGASVAGLTVVDPDDTTDANTNIVGTATYSGKAAGKFAVSDPLAPTKDDAGHFTADAELTADFKSAASTLQGTINAFRLNDGTADPGWTVTLRETANSTGTFSRTTSGTIWKIGENAGAAAGSWEARMYNDHATDSKADSNNTPDSVVGKFDAHIGGTHSMVGAFGAEHTGGN